MEQNMATTPTSREAVETVSPWCRNCGRMKGVGCVCGLSFKERIKSAQVILPANFRAVRG